MRAIITSCLLFISCGSYANEHTFSAVTSFHLDQANSPGYGFFYQYQPLESMQIDTGFIRSNSLEVTQDSKKVIGEFDSIYLGASILKQYSPSLSLQAGAGLGYVVNSTNDALIEQSKISPYLKFGANYNFSTRWAIELGQLTQFSSSSLDTNHSVFLSINYSFSPSTPTHKSPKALVPAAPEQATIIRQLHPTQHKVSEKKQTAIKADPVTFWTIQLGAFTNKENALRRLNQLQTQLLNEQTIKIIEHENLYKLVVEKFGNYGEAKLWLKHSELYTIGFVSYIH